jgi:CHASE2 domain-containing sensor protein
MVRAPAGRFYYGWVVVGVTCLALLVSAGARSAPGVLIHAHQVGAALAAYLGGRARVVLGDYQLAFLVAGVLAAVAGLLALRTNRAPRISAPGEVASASA